MLSIKFEKQEHQNKLFIDSIKLAVSQHLEHLHLNRLKTLPNKSNLLLAINQKSIRKIKTETRQKMELQRKGSLMSAIKRGENTGEDEFLDTHMDFRQYESNYKGEIQRSQSPKSPNIKPTDIKIKQIVPSRAVIKDFGLQEEQRSKDKIKVRSRNPSENYLQKHPLLKFETLEPKKKEVPSRLFPPLPMIPKLKHFSISYKEILFGKSLQLNKKELESDLHSSCEGPINKKQPTKLPNLSLSRSLDNSLRASFEGTTQPQKRISIPLKIKKKLSHKFANADLNFSPWSTKQSHFKGK